MGRQKCTPRACPYVSVACNRPVRTGVWRRPQCVELHKLLLATDEALLPERRVRIYVLEHLSRPEEQEQLGMVTEFSGQRGCLDQTLPLQPRLLPDEAPY